VRGGGDGRASTDFAAFLFTPVLNLNQLLIFVKNWLQIGFTTIFHGCIAFFRKISMLGKI